VGGSTFDEAPVASANTGIQTGTTVYITGMITRDIVDHLIEGLKDGFNRDVVIIPSNSRQASEIRQGT
jgi:hypothetical protein